jgi:hypothetical protein
MSYYTCCKCFFTFERVGEVAACPDCAHPNVRGATGEEIAEFLKNQAEYGSNQNAISR